MAENFRGAARGIKQAGEHLERGGFARAVRAEKTDEFAGFNLETDFVDGERLLVLATEKPFDRAGKSGLLFVGAKGFGQAVDFDDRHGAIVESRRAGVERGNFQRINCFSR